MASKFIGTLTEGSGVPLLDELSETYMGKYVRLSQQEVHEGPLEDTFQCIQGYLF
jgi:hypothetical protein